MDNNRISLTPTVARQTPPNAFGTVLRDAVKTGGQVSGALLNAMPGAGIVSAAITNVTSLANQGAVARASTTGVVTLGPTIGGGGSVSSQVSTGATEVPASLSGMVDAMREEANRSMVMQMNMQQESREYNALSNVLKVRHDSAKAAINNLR